VANSALDWTGTPRGAPSIAAFDLDGAPVAGGFAFADTASFGYPKQLAFDAAGNLWMTTTFGLMLGYTLPAAPSPTPFAVLVGVGGAGGDLFDTANALTFDGAGNLWLTGSLAGAGRALRIDAGGWADVGVILGDALFGPYGLAFGSDGALWIVNSTDAADDDESRGSLLRYDAGALTDGASPSASFALASRYTLGIAVDRP
jgi:sugar lactone lactonase YvrE